MPTLYIANSFSLSMLDRLWQMTPKARVPRPVRDPYDFVRSWSESDNPNDEVLSIVGHADTATLFSELLGIPVVHNRMTVELRSGDVLLVGQWMPVELRPGDVLLVGQYKGPRLPEGATELPEGATIEWWSI